MQFAPHPALLRSVLSDLPLPLAEHFQLGGINDQMSYLSTCRCLDVDALDQLADADVIRTAQRPDSSLWRGLAYHEAVAPSLIQSVSFTVAASRRKFDLFNKASYLLFYQIIGFYFISLSFIYLKRRFNLLSS